MCGVCFCMKSYKVAPIFQCHNSITNKVEAQKQPGKASIVLGDLSGGGRGGGGGGRKESKRSDNHSFEQ